MALNEGNPVLTYHLMQCLGCTREMVGPGDYCATCAADIKDYRRRLLLAAVERFKDKRNLLAHDPRPIPWRNWKRDGMRPLVFGKRKGRIGHRD